MISSSGETGGGPIQMSILSNKLKKYFDFYFAIPNSQDLLKLLNKANHFDIFFISERTIKINELIELSKYVKKNSIDLIHSHGKGAAVIGRFISLILRKPHIYTYHGIHTLCYGKIYNFIYRIYELVFGLIDSRKIFVSQSEKKFARKIGIYFQDNYSIIPNGIESENVEKKSKNFRKNFRLKYGINNHEKCVVSVCRFVEQKNIFEIIKIARLCDNYKFLIIGGGPLNEKLKIFIKKLNLKNIILPGIVHNVFEYLYISDLFLSTSLYEGMPLSIIEAMSIGLPILASNVTGNIDTIEDYKSGFFYELGDVLMASERIKFILENDVLYQKISKNSKSRQRLFFNVSKMSKAYKNVYVNCMSNNLDNLLKKSNV